MTSKCKNAEEGQPLTLILAVVVFLMLIIAHVLRTMENENLPLAGFVLGFAFCLLIVALIIFLFSHLSSTRKIRR